MGRSEVSGRSRKGVSRRLVATVAGVTALSSCGGGRSSGITASADPSPPYCFFSQASAAAILGGPVEQPTALAGECIYGLQFKPGQTVAGELNVTDATALLSMAGGQPCSAAGSAGPEQNDEAIVVTGGCVLVASSGGASLSYNAAWVVAGGYEVQVETQGIIPSVGLQDRIQKGAMAIASALSAPTRSG
jgi:hypothetical protein